MKSEKPVNSPKEGAPAGAATMLIPVLVSIFGHLALMAMFVFVPQFTLNRDAAPRVINVSLVSLPTKPGAPMTRTPSLPAAPEKPTPPEPAVEPEKPTPVPPTPKKPPEMQAPAKPSPPKKTMEKEAVSLAPKNAKPKISLKKKTYKAEKVVARAVKRIEKQAETSRPDPVKAAIERMRSSVREREAAGTTTAGDATGTGGEKRAMALLDIYRIEIAHNIQKNWAFSEQMADHSKNLTAWVMIEVSRSGKIREFWFEKRSGNAYLDDSASRAIQKSNPLPPFPEGVTRSSIHQGFRFTPSGIK